MQNFEMETGEDDTKPFDLREAVIAELDEEMDNMLAAAPPSLLESARRSIKTEALAYAKRVLGSLSTAELRSETARQRFTITVLRDAERRVRGFSIVT